MSNLVIICNYIRAKVDGQLFTPLILAIEKCPTVDKLTILTYMFKYNHTINAKYRNAALY